MFTLFVSLLSSVPACFRTRAALQAEILALRHQLLVLRRSGRGHKLRLSSADRTLWVWLSRLWTEWRSALIIVKPENESGQPALGCSAHSWGTNETRYLNLASNSGEVHGPAPKAAVVELAYL